MNTYTAYGDFLTDMIGIPAVSRYERDRADWLESDFLGAGYRVERIANNLVMTTGIHPSQATLLLNSHIDTVPPSGTWDSDPYTPVRKDGMITGLGSNDAGASLTALSAAFRAVAETNPAGAETMALVLSAEEEISGSRGFGRLLPLFSSVRFAVVGEPTGMQPAVAERGLMVIDAAVTGRSGHAARKEGINAIYRAMEDIEAIRGLRFDHPSSWLPDPGITVTMIEGGKAHNVTPGSCNYVIDVRSNDRYPNETLLEMLEEHTGAQLEPRSMRLQPSGLPEDHPVFPLLQKLGLTPFGSPTLSDMALMPWPSVKIGPGASERSHTPGEYILEEELYGAIGIYIKLMNGLISVL